MQEFETIEGYDVEFVLVNDNSRDQTFEQIRLLSAEYSNVHGISLMRNFGQHNALMCAMNYTHGDLVLGMDDDMQTHPSQIRKLLEKQQEGYDIVYGVYEKSTNSAGKNLTSWFKAGVFCVGMGSKLFPKEVIAANDWHYITEKCKECFEIIKDARN